MKRIKIVKLLKLDTSVENVLIKGWVRTIRNSKTFSFIEVNDGSCLKNVQIVADTSLENYKNIEKINTGSAIAVSGKLIASPGGGQKWEIQAENIDIISATPDHYPLQKKRHSDEFLRTIAHLRPRTNKYGATFRIRSELAYAIHDFFRKEGFFHIHTPILTGSDCEGAGELFQVTTLDLQNIVKKNQSLDYSKDFFGKIANLTVSGQLSAEMFALALGDVYTFGPTFRAENSNTRRHVAEFWMVEPEMAFCDLTGNMDMGEKLIKNTVSHVLQKCEADISLFARFVDKNLAKTLQNIIESDFIRTPYDEAIRILKKSKTKFEYPVSRGKDLQSEHECFLTEQYFKKPVIIIDYPKAIKPFYMRVNDDNETVAAMDVLVPRIGEIIGGSQREERLSVIEARMAETGLSKDAYWWYIDSRQYGSVEHSGFGLGFERLLMLVTGISNIRDVVPFPRTPNSIEF